MRALRCAAGRLAVGRGCPKVGRGAAAVRTADPRSAADLAEHLGSTRHAPLTQAHRLPRDLGSGALTYRAAMIQLLSERPPPGARRECRWMRAVCVLPSQTSRPGSACGTDH